MVVKGGKQETIGVKVKSARKPRLILRVQNSEVRSATDASLELQRVKELKQRHQLNLRRGGQ